MATELLYPTGRGAFFQQLKSGPGSNWDFVNDVTPDDDAGYTYGRVQSAVPSSLVDSHILGDLVATDAVISQVTVRLRARTVTNSGMAQIAPLVRIGSTVYEGTLTTMPGTWSYLSKLWGASPATGQAWTVAEVNAMQAGSRIDVAGDWVGYSEVRCTQVRVSVDLVPVRVGQMGLIVFDLDALAMTGEDIGGVGSLVGFNRPWNGRWGA